MIQYRLKLTLSDVNFTRAIFTFSIFLWAGFPHSFFVVLGKILLQIQSAISNLVER